MDLLFRAQERQMAGRNHVPFHDNYYSEKDVSVTFATANAF